MTDCEYREEITEAIAQLRQLTQIDVQAGWHFFAGDDAIAPPMNPADWQPALLNEKGFIVWPKGRQVRWLVQKFIIPPSLRTYPIAGLSLRLALTWWAEDAKVFVNGRLVQEGDLFESSTRILLCEAARPGEEFIVAVRLVSPGHDIGALMRSRCIYEGEGDRLDPGFVADELEVLQKYWQAFAPQKLELLATAIAEIDWKNVANAEIFGRSLSTLHTHLQPHAADLKERCVKMLSHAHLDLAWLWEVEETWDVAQRTFESVLQLQQEFPDLTFCHTSPALYAWIEKNRSDLFAAIQAAVSAGSWEVVGGMWVEPEVNLVSGESLARQLLYGQRYTQEKFGRVAKVAWLTDSFGFCWQLPQLLKQAGIDYFVTQKLHWNDSTKFPHGFFWWRSPDGTQIQTLMSPPNVAGVMDASPQPIADYAIAWEQQTGFQNIFWLPGVGDRGGGPSRDMLQVQQSWRNSPFFPRLEFTTAQEYLEQLSEREEGKGKREQGIGNREQVIGKGEEGQIQDSMLNVECSMFNETLPVWNDELYLEFHRGCYTTRGEQKWFNRRCDRALYAAELWSSVAQIVAVKPYPKSELETAWKHVLFNQFHDILPGTSIPEVFERANSEWDAALSVSEEIVTASLNAIATCIQLPPPPHPDAKPLFVFNSLNWTRSQVVEIPSLKTDGYVCNAQGDPIPSQLTGETQLFLAEDIPSVGYRLFWLCPMARDEGMGNWEDGEMRNWGDFGLSSISERCDPPSNPAANESPNTSGGLGGRNAPAGGSGGQSPPENLGLDESIENFILENSYLQIIVDPQTGELSSIFDKTARREILDGNGNQLQAFRDEGQYWDAWNIDPDYEQHPLPPPQLQSIQSQERGELRHCLRIVRKLNNSEFRQDYLLEANSPLLKIETTVDWQERHALVKAAFPFNFAADFATYEIACGAIARTTKPQTPEEQAKWEVPALQWADLTSAEGYGVSLLNDCKHGYDSRPNQLRLTLLRGSTWPDPDSDRGIHHFTYAIYPHRDSWQAAQTVRRGYELNEPLRVLQPEKAIAEPKLPPTHTFLNLSAENLILTAFKPSEDDPNAWILRCYECHGETAKLTFNNSLGLTLSHPVDLLEQPSVTEFSEAIAPWKIASFAAIGNISRISPN